MVKLDSVRSQVLSLVNNRTLVAAFIGGTSGIGEYTLRELVSAHGTRGKGLKVYIVGRKAHAAEKIIADCLRICPKGKFQFVKAMDLALLSDVDSVCERITSLEKERQGDTNARLDFLVMSAATLLVKGRLDTSEGLDRSMSLLYYARVRCILKLMPLLLKSDLPAHVVSVYGAGLESNIIHNDLSLRDSRHYSFAQQRSHVVFMKTLMMEHLAKQYRGQLSLIHIYPGLILTDAFYVSELPKWFRLAFRLMAPLLSLFTTSAQEIGQRVIFLATPRYPALAKSPDATQSTPQNDFENPAAVAMGSDKQLGSGAYAVKYDGETVVNDKSYRAFDREELTQTVVNHTLKAFEEIEQGNVFRA